MNPPLPPAKPARSNTPHQPTRRQRIVARTLRIGVDLLAATQRFELSDVDKVLDAARAGPVIFATWHNRLALSMHVRRRFLTFEGTLRPIAALVSASRDGALLAAILESFGVQPVRGSSSRRGRQAVLELVTWAERGYDIAITPDGPRGPKYIVQPGVVGLARLTGRPIIPTLVNTSFHVRLPSWDRFEIPLPGSRCEFSIGPALHVPRDAPSLEPFQAELQKRLLALTRDRP